GQAAAGEMKGLARRRHGRSFILPPLGQHREKHRAQMPATQTAVPAWSTAQPPTAWPQGFTPTRCSGRGCRRVRWTGGQKHCRTTSSWYDGSDAGMGCAALLGRAWPLLGRALILVRRPKATPTLPKWYAAGREAAMIELTEQQVEALEHAEATPPRIVNPRTNETFVLLRIEEYERLQEDKYDDSP